MSGKVTEGELSKAIPSKSEKPFGEKGRWEKAKKTNGGPLERKCETVEWGVHGTGT